MWTSILILIDFSILTSTFAEPYNIPGPGSIHFPNFNKLNRKICLVTPGQEFCTGQTMEIDKPNNIGPFTNENFSAQKKLAYIENANINTYNENNGANGNGYDNNANCGNNGNCAGGMNGPYPNGNVGNGNGYGNNGQQPPPNPGYPYPYPPVQPIIIEQQVKGKNQAPATLKINIFTLLLVVFLLICK